MTLLRPEFLAFGLLGIVIALAYLRIIPTPKQVVGSLDLWQIALARRPWWYGLQRPLSLAFLLSIIALLAFAVAEPVILAPEMEPRRIVLVVDTSASMGTKEKETTRLELARDAAAKWIDTLSTNDRMAIVAAGSGVRFACDFTNDPAKLKLALGLVKPTEGPDSAAEAVAMVRGPTTQVVLFTDGVFPEFAKLDAEQSDDKLLISLHGAASDNVGYTRIAARPSPDDNEAYDVLVEITGGPTSRFATPSLNLNGKSFASQTIPIQPGQTVARTFKVAAPQGGLLEARFKIEDSLEADNCTYLRLEPRQPVAVYVLEGVDPSVAKSLENLPGIKLESARSLPASLAAGSVVVVQGDVPKSLPAAHLLVIGPTAETDSWKIGEPLEPPPSVQMVGRAPFVAAIDLADVVVERTVDLKLMGDDLRVVASAGETPILALREAGARRLVLLNLDLTKSDLTLRPAWSPMVRSMITWLAGRSESTVVSQNIEAPFVFAPNAAERTLTGPDGFTRKIPPQATHSYPPDRTGKWQLSGDGGETYQVMLGLPGETALATPAKRAEIAPPPRAEAARDFHFAPWLVFVAAVLVVLEWALFHRRLTI